MAPGRRGELYVATDDTIALFDAAGRLRPGWPIRLSDECYAPLVARDGSVRIVCAGKAHALSRDGKRLPGWPVRLPDGIGGVDDAQVADGGLVLLASRWEEDEESEESSGSSTLRLVTITRDGSMRLGQEAMVGQDRCYDWRIQQGPDGRGYLLAYLDCEDATDPSPTTEITALDMDGWVDGWSIRVAGWPSNLAFGPGGRLYLTRAREGHSPVRVLVFDAEGNRLPASSDALPVVATPTYQGAGPVGGPPAPLVTPDRTVFLVTEDRGTTAYALNRSGDVLPGWPYRAKSGLQWSECAPMETGCASWRMEPVAGPNNVLYLVHPPRSNSTGERLAAVGRNGKMLAGWPVQLKRAGAGFGSVVAGSNGTVYALAGEPEGRGYSATILAIRPDSSIRYRLTVVEP